MHQSITWSHAVCRTK